MKNTKWRARGDQPRMIEVMIRGEIALQVSLSSKGDIKNRRYAIIESKRLCPQAKQLVESPFRIFPAPVPDRNESVELEMAHEEPIESEGELDAWDYPEEDI
jgi:hypothetical protein